MDVIGDKDDKELLASILSEIAKASNEIRCARGDIDKAQNRLKFALLVANELIERQRISR